MKCKFVLIFHLISVFILISLVISCDMCQNIVADKNEESIRLDSLWRLKSESSFFIIHKLPLGFDFNMTPSEFDKNITRLQKVSGLYESNKIHDGHWPHDYKLVIAPRDTIFLNFFNKNRNDTITSIVFDIDTEQIFYSKYSELDRSDSIIHCFDRFIHDEIRPDTCIKYSLYEPDDTYEFINYYKDNLAVIITRDVRYNTRVVSFSVEFNNTPKGISSIMSSIYVRRYEREQQIKENIEKDMKRMSNKYKRYEPPTNIHSYRIRVRHH